MSTAKKAALLSTSASLLRAISEIPVTKQTTTTALAQLEFASDQIIHGTIDAADAQPMKTSFLQKIGQLEDLKPSNHRHLATSTWVTNTGLALDKHANAHTNGGEDLPKGGFMADKHDAGDTRSNAR